MKEQQTTIYRRSMGHAAPPPSSSRALLQQEARAVRLNAGPDAPTVIMSIPRPERMPRGTPAPQSIAPTPVAAAPEPSPRPPAEAAPRLPNIATDRPEVFALIRRLAMQHDLASATGLLHFELGTLLGARVVMALVGENREITCPIPADLRAAASTLDLAQLATCVAQGRPIAQPRMLILPLDTQSKAVLVAYRAADASPFDAQTQHLALAIASRLDVLDHVLSLHASQRAQDDADRASIFRAEALKASRDPQRAGAPVHLAPRIVRLAIPAILAIAVILVAAAAIVHVPTYSRGSVVVTMNGHNVLSDGAGRVASVHVTPGQLVAVGDPLITLESTREKQELDQIETAYRDQLSSFLFEPTDQAARQSLAAVLVQRKAAQDHLDMMTIRAPVAGRVSAILAGDLIQQGEHVVTITPENAEASVIGFMPGSDRSRIQVGMKLHVELTGYSGTRMELTITEVGAEIISANEARKLLGQKLADGVALPPLVVVVKAKLSASTFQADDKTFSYFDGMDGRAEIEVTSKSFLSVILPSGS